MNRSAIKARLLDIGTRAMNRGHRFVLAVSGGRLLATPFGMPTVELHTVGRRSGQPRSCYLTAPVHDERRVVLVASKGGADRHPDWYLNLVARPDAEIEIHGRRRAVHARTATPEEKAELWPRIVRAYRGYAAYQKWTTRQIPVVICEL